MKSNSKDILVIELTLALDSFQSSCKHLKETVDKVKKNNSTNSPANHFLNTFTEGLDECIELSEVDREDLISLIYNPYKTYVCLVCQSKGYVANVFGIKVRCKECDGKGLFTK